MEEKNKCNKCSHTTFRSYLVCRSAFVDPKYGSSEGELNNFERPFNTIKDAIDVIKKKKPSPKARWTIFLAPCTFKEDVKPRPFIDIHGYDRTNSVIEGVIDGSKLKHIDDEVTLKELTINGYINKRNGLGMLNLFELDISTKYFYPIIVSAGSLRMDSCFIEQDIISDNSAAFYFIKDNAMVNLIIRNTRHTRRVLVPISPNIIISSYRYINTNRLSEVISHTNLFVNNFDSFFNGLLIPYDANNASGLINSQSDNYRFSFTNGAGSGRKFITSGLIISSGFILTRKNGINLEVSIHSVKLLGLNTSGTGDETKDSIILLSDAIGQNSTKAKIKHAAWVGLRDIPPNIIIPSSGQLVVIQRSKRSHIGVASDNKLFIGRPVYEIEQNTTLNASLGNVPPLPQLPIHIIPDNVAIYQALTASVILQLPTPSTGTIGQTITIIFGVPGQFVVSAENVEPDLGFTTGVQDLGVSATQYFPYIVYSSVPTLSRQTAGTMFGLGFVSDALSVTFTLKGVPNQTNPTALIWSGITTPQPLSASRIALGPGIRTIDVPINATNVFIQAWGGGGAGGPVIAVGPEFNPIRAGSGGGSAAGFVYNTPVDPTTRTITLSVGSGGKNPGNNGEETRLTIGDFIAVAQGGFGGITIGTSGEFAPGGAGGVITITVAGNPIPPPSGFVGTNGVQGGGTSSLVNAAVCGNPGQNNPQGFSGGQPGCIDPGNSGTVVSGAGGGAGGYNGNGGSGNNFTFNSEAAFSFQNNGGGIAAQSNSGAGGAGQGPDVPEFQPGIPGGDGGGIVIFS